MPLTNINPTRFVKKGTPLEVSFIGDNDRYEWYSGTVIGVNHYGKNSVDTFIDCSIMYSDGEFVRNSLLYDKDFDKVGLDAWRIDSPLTTLLTYNRMNDIEIEFLEEELLHRKEMETQFNKLFEEGEYSFVDDDVVSDEPDEEESESESESYDSLDSEEKDDQTSSTVWLSVTSLILTASIVLKTGLLIRRLFGW